MNQEEYNRLLSQVAPSPELVKRTREQIHLEGERRRKKAESRWLFRGFRRGLAVAAAMLVMGVNISPAFARMLEKVPVLGQAVQVVTVRNWFSQQGNRQITVDQPGLSGDGASWAVNINEEIQQTVDRYLEEANQRLEEYKQAVLATGGSEEEFDSRHFQVSVDYEIQYQSDQYLSYVLYGRESWTGAGQITRFYNLDLTTGEVLTLEQLLGENWKELAEQAVRQQMAQRDPEGNLYFPPEMGASPQVTEETSFYLNENGDVVLYFEPYTIAPGGYGPQTFAVEREEEAGGEDASVS